MRGYPTLKFFRSGGDIEYTGVFFIHLCVEVVDYLLGERYVFIDRGRFSEWACLRTSEPTTGRADVSQARRILSPNHKRRWF